MHRVLIGLFVASRGFLDLELLVYDFKLFERLDGLLSGALISVLERRRNLCSSTGRQGHLSD